MNLKEKKSSGFTLIELTVVIAILGLIYAFFIPRFENLTGLELKSEARKVATLVKYTYDSSVSKNKKLRMVFGFSDESDQIWIEEWHEKSQKQALKDKNEDEDKLTLSEKEAMDNAPSGEFVKVTDDYATLKLKDYVKIKGIYLARYSRTFSREDKVEKSSRSKTEEQETPSLLFLPQGLTDNAIIYLSDGKGRDYSIRVNPITGKPTIFNYYVDPKDI